jgi:hypothetical protein
MLNLTLLVGYIFETVDRLIDESEDLQADKPLSESQSRT